MTSKPLTSWRRNGLVLATILAVMATIKVGGCSVLRPPQPVVVQPPTPAPAPQSDNSIASAPTIPGTNIRIAAPSLPTPDPQPDGFLATFRRINTWLLVLAGLAAVGRAIGVVPLSVVSYLFLLSVVGWALEHSVRQYAPFIVLVSVGLTVFWMVRQWMTGKRLHKEGDLRAGTALQAAVDFKSYLNRKAMALGLTKKPPKTTKTKRSKSDNEIDYDDIDSFF